MQDVTIMEFYESKLKDVVQLARDAIRDNECIDLDGLVLLAQGALETGELFKRKDSKE